MRFSPSERPPVLGGISVFLLLLLAAALSPAHTAASGNESDVQATVNRMSTAGGHTLNAPCSPATVVWITTLTSSNGFRLNFEGSAPNTDPSTLGSGTNCFTICDDDTTGPIIAFTPTYQSGLSDDVVVTSHAPSTPDSLPVSGTGVGAFVSGSQVSGTQFSGAQIQ